MKTALVIDDNREAVDSVCRMLSLLDIQAKPAYGPRAAILALKDFTPNIIFMDINMPGVDGFEVLAYLRRFPKLADTPVVFITSDDQPETEIKARKTSALLVLIKPATFESLEATLKKAGLV
jgi:CheY-like chemotaxis protein